MAEMIAGGKEVKDSHQKLQEDMKMGQDKVKEEIKLESEG